MTILIRNFLAEFYISNSATKKALIIVVLPQNWQKGKKQGGEQKNRK